MEPGHDERGGQAGAGTAVKPIIFLSDLHLGASYISDEHRAERRVVDFLHTHCRDAAEVYLLGDVLDYWYEYRTVVPRGYVRFFGALASLVDSGVKVHWFIGNHDIWLFDYVRDEIGVEVVDGCVTRDIYGKRFYLGHGDGVGKLPLGFRFIRSMFRNRLCQKLYAAIHPRWTIPMAHAWSASNRDFGGKYATPQFEGIEREPQAKFALDYLANVDPTVNYFVFGHRHVLADVSLTPTSRLIILGDWIEQFTYAIYDGHDLKLEHYQERNIETQENHIKFNL